MKRIIAFLLACTMLSLVACGKGGEESFESESDVNNESESGVASMETEKTAEIEVEADKNLSFSLIKNTDIDALLARPYIEGVPTAFSEGLFSTYSAGWGFKNGTVLATGNESGFGLPIDISINDKSISPQEAIWMPSHVKSMYDSSKSFDNIASEAAVSASYTSQYDKDGLKHLTDGVVSYNDDTRNRWSNYANPIRTQNETITFDFAKTVTCASLKVHLYDDEGNTLIPKAMKVEYYDGSNWVSAKNQACGTIARCIGVDINFDAVQTTAVRLIVIPQTGKAVAITEVKVLGRSESAQAIPSGVTVEEKKFITENDVVASVLSFTNKTSETVSFKISASP
ncbi:MAG: discoidin domain-containing protein, partial [Clostridia bacterium]|nr:discoidin domain-containing protein [Clostridia bacterium]